MAEGRSVGHTGRFALKVALVVVHRWIKQLLVDLGGPSESQPSQKSSLVFGVSSDLSGSDAEEVASAAKASLAFSRFCRSFSVFATCKVGTVGGLGDVGFGIGGGGLCVDSVKALVPVSFGGFATSDGLVGRSAFGGSCVGLGMDDKPSSQVAALLDVVHQPSPQLFVWLALMAVQLVVLLLPLVLGLP